MRKMDYPEVQNIYISPLKRCVQTAEILFPGELVHIIDELAECDFGEFENKNYKELDGNPQIPGSGLTATVHFLFREERAEKHLSLET